MTASRRISPRGRDTNRTARGWGSTTNRRFAGTVFGLPIHVCSFGWTSTPGVFWVDDGIAAVNFLDVDELLQPGLLPFSAKLSCKTIPLFRVYVSAARYRRLNVRVLKSPDNIAAAIELVVPLEVFAIRQGAGQTIALGKPAIVT